MEFLQIFALANYFQIIKKYSLRIEGTVGLVYIAKIMHVGPMSQNERGWGGGGEPPLGAP